MPARKNEWLNAKPMTKTGGKSGGVRNPKKPYKKPAKPASEKPARWEAKTKSERLQEAAKTKAKSPAPKQVIKKPVTRTGPVKGPVPPKDYSAGAAGMPNSAREGFNLPKTGARSQRTATRATQLIKDARAKTTSSAKPSSAASASTSVAKPTSKAASGLKGAMGRLGRFAGPIGLGITGADLAEQAGFARGGKNYREFTRAQDKPPAKPVKNDPNGRSSRGVNTPKGRTVATGSQQYNDYRNKQIADNRERLKGVGNPPAAKPKPPAPARDRGGNNSPAAPRPKSAPAMPKKPFAGSVSEGRKMWAEKYSSSKYDGQAIQKEAKALLKKMKEEKNNESSAKRAGWDGNKNY